MLPGTVASDSQAFQQILGRLEGEVGSIIRLIPEAKANGLWKDTAPLWSLVRMMFPVAESLADLIYRTTSTAQNLKQALETEFEAVRPGLYRGKSAVLALLFRHSLTHTDELRTLVSAGRDVGWLLSYGRPADHMKVVQAGTSSFGIHFDTTAFYDDLHAVCLNAQRAVWGDTVMHRYNGWLTLNLDTRRFPRLQWAVAIPWQV